MANENVAGDVNVLVVESECFPQMFRNGGGPFCNGFSIVCPTLRH